MAENSSKKFLIKIGGYNNTSSILSQPRHDGNIRVSYLYTLGYANAADVTLNTGEKIFTNGETEYSKIFPDYKETAPELSNSKPVMLNYDIDYNLNLQEEEGIIGDSIGTEYSIYKREYEVYQRPGNRLEGYLIDGNFYENQTTGSAELKKNSSFLYIDKPTNIVYNYNSASGVFTPIPAYKIYKGEWKPVAIKVTGSSLRDFNITSGRTYQYIIYPSNTGVEQKQVLQTYANYDSKIFVENEDYQGQGKFIQGDWDSSTANGGAISTNLNYWSIVELDPMENPVDAPVVKKTYKADINKMWMFKYSFESGTNTQNIGRTEFQTLGQYIKIGYSDSNFDSGDVSCYLGSEIIPYSKSRYIERLGESRITPLSTNEKVEMLKQWKQFVYSKKPKLLRDIKGNSWIVQIMGGSNTPSNFILNQPDKIEFQWKQIDSAENCVIYGEIGNKQQLEEYGSQEWKKSYGKN